VVYFIKLLKSSQRIRKNKEFLNLYKKGGFFKNQFFLLKFVKNNLKNSRFGFVVSLKVSKRAVDRNLLKRRMREIIRSLDKNIEDGYDVVFIMNSNSLNIKFVDLKNNVINSLNSVKLLKKISRL
jgi:ribonuclease P protein component